jgi:DNA-binding NarL/FixJ family response regulator
MRAISIVVADDHPATLHGITAALTSNSDMSVVASCSNGTAALRAICQLAPTVAVLDMSMPGLSGLDVLADIRAERCATRAVLLTEDANDSQLLTAITRGAKGIVSKGAAVSELVECVRRVAAGGHWLRSDLLDAALDRGAACQSAGDATESLTVRQRQIIRMVAGGLSNKDVGRRLDLSEGTVKVHLHNVYRKLGINSRSALTSVAITEDEDVQPSSPCEVCGYRLLAMSPNVSDSSLTNPRTED